jgi:hypothetical protein
MHVQKHSRRSEVAQSAYDIAMDEDVSLESRDKAADVLTELAAADRAAIIKCYERCLCCSGGCICSLGRMYCMRSVERKFECTGGLWRSGSAHWRA